MECVIAVHAGAGYQKATKEANYKKICMKACKKGLEILKNNGSALDAVAVATMVLEDSPLTNAGYGSNLTWNGAVECDASIIDGSNMHYGGVGAVSGIKNPIALAKLICENQNLKMSFGRIPPCLLVGLGAHEYAIANNIVAVDPFNLISEKSKKDFVHNKYKVINQKYSNCQAGNSRLDTVGCVGMDKLGNVAASSSSGGILLKQDGRVGQAALLGSGCWAQNMSDDVAMAVTTSGCGEHLIKTNLAREMSKQLLNSSCPTIAITKCFNEDFIHSPILKNCNEKLAGALVLYKNKDCCEILSAHTTKSMCIAYATENDKKSFVSRLMTNTLPGTSVMVQGYPI
ncbi:threonine aspartase 1 isoform X1 [Acyrthosiphon pisum]|uniref:Threonine aspartase 1 n=2 Tax=Acyrthosiphon pisum TaxID=7029 RepID=A0A8R2ACB0_ACYPI|nr:threonine aspartase 1 isoform X1 [Acyrthosiphon pisum]|eukprot:XP_001947449.1 PREDICTED: threonine aspartase 1 isoform X1 [Acyrthosiphon pisum]